MAITTAAFWSLTMTFRDWNKNTGRTSINLADDLVTDDLVAALDGALGTVMAGVSDAVLVSYALTRTGRDYAPADAPITSDVERKGSFSFLADNGQIVSIEVPSIKKDLVIAGTNLIDEADAAVIAFVGYMEGGIAGALAPVTNTGAGLSSLLSATQTHRGSSKG